MESTRKELQWSTFQAWVGRNKGMILEAHPQDADDNQDMGRRAQGLKARPWLMRPGPYVYDQSGWALGPLVGLPALAFEENLASSSPTSEDYWGLCLSFTLSDAEEAACDFDIAEIVQATFYAMGQAGALKLTLTGPCGLLSIDKHALLEAQLRQQVRPGRGVGPHFLMAETLNFSACRGPGAQWGVGGVASILWAMFAVLTTSLRVTNPWRPAHAPLLGLGDSFPDDYRSLFPYFDLKMAKTSTQDFRIPTLTQAIFYAMVLNDVVALRVTCVIIADALTSVLECLNLGVFESWLEMNEEALRRAHSQRLAHLGADLKQVGGQEENSGSSDAPPSSSHANIEEDIVHPWEIDVVVNCMYDFQECRMARIRLAGQLGSPKELLAEGTSEGNPRSSSGSHTSSIQVESASARSSSKGKTNGPGRAALKRGRAHEEPVQEDVAEEVVGEGINFPRASTSSDIQDGPSTNFPNLKVMASLKRPTLEEKYLLPAGYKFIIPEVDATVNKPPPKCIAIYRVAFSYDRYSHWNNRKPIWNSFREPTKAEKKAFCYVNFYDREDDFPRPIPSFMARVIEAEKGPERKRSRSGDRETMN
ncbi:hypothetical protein Cgig2_025020 [Carnegiea gigantea]|uniref:Uncharacterized protein n=1 Tax=Carnegiea gigantea TaxID=171969 RepID=A0A9Q1QAL8_9CARY|nr:hypothetical protein Cgig2_025020 [Carnegiea gigantea]